MCRTGLEVLDVYPFTRSYPEGTGGPEVAYYKEHDIVHLKFHVMKTIDLFIEDYFRGQVVVPISLRNYVFSWNILLAGKLSLSFPVDRVSHQSECHLLYNEFWMGFNDSLKLAFLGCQLVGTREENFSKFEGKKRVFVRFFLPLVILSLVPSYREKLEQPSWELTNIVF